MGKKESVASKVFNNIFSFISIIVFISIVYIIMTEDDRRKKSEKEEKVEYPSVREPHMEFNGYVISRRFSNVYRGCYIYKLSNGQKFHIDNSTFRLNDTKLDMYEFLQIGDSIYKKTYTDSIYIYRKSKEYLFILGKRVVK